MINNMLATCALMGIVLGEVTAFSSQHHGARTGAAKTSQLMMSSSSSQSRRDILSNAASVAAVGLSALVLDPSKAVAFKPGPPTAQSAANKSAESYQGVYSDPNHPEGYRVIMASGKGATMTLSDGVEKDAPEGTEEKTYKNIPVAIKEGSNELSFDFSFKGGPKGVVGILSNDKQSITFPDGNMWKKNANEYDGIYKVTNYPNGYRIIRKFKSTKTITEVNNTGNPKDSKFIMGQHGSLFSIPTAAFTFYDYTGHETCTEKLCRSCEAVCKDELVGQFSLQESNTVFSYGTITFPDKTIWTRI
eukprot:CAMPEP_0172301014 /NCGR_PEP_ID=MMETSP1058-20130122/2996_1 /TAXON_ID=83371 /ORGANISM="Detonula confervacea, Strain CCMP 353" /LENGTH=303 /DNA_ID=CAMNT_0013010999 /DNA_START=1 /DNA_END=912 /DNA_ORIENTATION=+